MYTVPSSRRGVSVASRLLGGAVALIIASVLVACGSDEEAAPPAGATTTALDPDADLVQRYGTLRSRTTNPDADGRDVTSAVAGINRFSVDLYRAVTAEMDGNVVISPYSTVNALGMIFAGARGTTAAEMASVLQIDIPPAQWHEGLNGYALTLDARTAGSPTVWAAANKVWVQPGLALRNEFLDVLTGVYGSPVAEGDFAANAEAVRATINGWVRGRTSGHIVELFPENTIDQRTVLVLVNAIALDAPWEFPFDPASTVDAPFTLPDGTTVNVPTMHYDEYLPSATTDAYQAVELPYGGGALSMVVIVPNELAAFEAALTVESLASLIASIKDGGIHLSLPKWTSRTHLALNETLSALGMPSAFSAGADFSGMVDGGGLILDTVEHEAFVEVDEVGTRAAAATGGVMAVSHGPTVQVNRPFLYVIRDRGAGTILFIGRVTNPALHPS